MNKYGLHGKLTAKDGFEVWNSKEDRDNSLDIEGVRELISQAIPILMENH